MQIHTFSILSKAILISILLTTVGCITPTMHDPHYVSSFENSNVSLNLEESLVGTWRDEWAWNNHYFLDLLTLTQDGKGYFDYHRNGSDGSSRRFKYDVQWRKLSANHVMFIVSLGKQVWTETNHFDGNRIYRTVNKRTMVRITDAAGIAEKQEAVGNYVSLADGLRAFAGGVRSGLNAKTDSVPAINRNPRSSVRFGDHLVDWQSKGKTVRLSDVTSLPEEIRSLKEVPGQSNLIFGSFNGNELSQMYPSGMAADVIFNNADYLKIGLGWPIEQANQAVASGAALTDELTDDLKERGNKYHRIIRKYPVQSNQSYVLGAVEVEWPETGGVSRSFMEMMEKTKQQGPPIRSK